MSLRNDLKAVLLHEHLDKVRTGPSFEAFVTHAYDVLAEHKVEEFSVVYESLRHLAGVQLTEKRITSVSWRLAGNLNRLKSGYAVPPWTVPAYKEWVPAQLQSCELMRLASGQVTRLFGVQIMAGTPAGMTAQVRWSGRACAGLSRHFGFTRPRRDGYSPFPYQAPEQFVTLRLEVLIDPEHCESGPGFHKVRMTDPQLRGWNKEQHKYRARAERGYECPYDIPHARPCHLCIYGWDLCRAGTHRQTYELRKCSVCLEESSPFDSDSALMCVNCKKERVLLR